MNSLLPLSSQSIQICWSSQGPVTKPLGRFSCQAPATKNKRKGGFGTCYLHNWKGTCSLSRSCASIAPKQCSHFLPEKLAASVIHTVRVHREVVISFIWKLLYYILKPTTKSSTKQFLSNLAPTLQRGDPQASFFRRAPLKGTFRPQSMHTTLPLLQTESFMNAVNKNSEESSW